MNFLLIVISLFSGFLIFYLIRKYNLCLHHTLFWIVIALIILFLGIFPQSYLEIAKILKISYPPVLPLLGAVILLFLKSLHQDIELTRKHKEIRRLFQEIAILKKEVEKNSPEN